MSGINYKFYTKTDTAWEAMLADLERASVSIDLERFIFFPDTVGTRFIDLLIRKSRQGIKVRILLDMVGSYWFYRSTAILNDLAKAGVQVKFFNPISPWRITNVTSYFFRDHRKFLIIDGKIGYIGGTGIDEKTKDWRDTEVCFEGDLVADFTLLFDRLWESTLKQKFMRFNMLPLKQSGFWVLTNSPRFGERRIYRAYLKNIRQSRNYIYLTTPYFIPDLRFLTALRRAARRGVDVRILVPRGSNHSFVDNSTRSYFTLALRAGIRIYLYEPGMLHAKTAVIDDAWSAIGTFNLDNLSFHYNYEAVVISTEKDFIRTLKDHFINDREVASEVYYEEWIRRPFLDKVREFITWPFHDLF